jgi:uncharacterized protein (DUF1501 family)
MDALTRRRFLVASGVTGGTALASGAAGMTLGHLVGTARGEAASWGGSRTGKLVIVTLYGGNDGLNTVIPYPDRHYHDARPEIAYQPEQVLPLDGALGLNPMLRGLRGLWDRRMLAIVRGVGYPKPDRSHFRSMDIWQTASPQRPTGSGWVGRWLDGTKAPPQAAVSFETVLPPLLVGEARVGSCVDVESLQLPPGIAGRTIARLGGVEAGEPAMVARAADSYLDLIKMEQLIQEAQHAAPASGAADPDIPATGTGGDNTLATQLSVAAGCIEAGVATRVYSVGLGGFDTHASERTAQERLLHQLDAALTAFVTRMARSEAGRRVAVLVYSEFGRRVRANASDGTDHGTAGPVFVLGPRVAGGFYGEQPSLTDLDSGDLKATVDFRDVYGSVLTSVLRAEPARYLDGYQPHPLPMFPDFPSD